MTGRQHVAWHARARGLRELQQRLADALEHSGDYRAAAAPLWLPTSTAMRTVPIPSGSCAGPAPAWSLDHLFARGEWDRTAGVCEDVLASAAAPHARAVGAGLLGLVHAMRGAARLAHARGETLLADQPETAEHELSTAAEMFSRLDLPLEAAQAQRRAATAAIRLGDHTRAVTAARRACHRRPARRPPPARKLHRGVPPARLHTTPPPVLAPRDRRPHQPRTGRHTAGSAGKHQQANRTHLVHQPAHRRDAPACKSCSAGPGPKRYAGLPNYKHCPSCQTRPDRSRANHTTPAKGASLQPQERSPGFHAHDPSPARWRTDPV